MPPRSLRLGGSLDLQLTWQKGDSCGMIIMRKGSPLYCFVWRLNNTTKGVAFSLYSFKLSYRDSDFVLPFGNRPYHYLVS